MDLLSSSDKQMHAYRIHIYRHHNVDGQHPTPLDMGHIMNSFVFSDVDDPSHVIFGPVFFGFGLKIEPREQLKIPGKAANGLLRFSALGLKQVASV